jgi:predicted nucleic acid-binding protein
MSDGQPSAPSMPRINVVIDASVAVKWFVPEDHSTDALRFLDPTFRPHAPALLPNEFAQTLWKKVYLRHEVDVIDGREILRRFVATPIEVHVVDPLLQAAFDIALATGRMVYDSVYLALANSLGCRLVTADRKLFNALQGGPFAGDVRWIADPI